ncbi:hypothetical protein [Streptomyces longisporoflavus]|uniref:Integral membrane protein n=1 Tax=Streptomyces longisporoflavus TaxID=28044 RepID=A0ABW7QHU7_9ACTN
MAVIQGILAAIATALVGLTFAGLLAAWENGGVAEAEKPSGPGATARPGTDTGGVTLKKGTADTGDTRGDWDEVTALYSFSLLSVVAAIVLLELAMADVVSGNGCLWAIAALCALMVSGVPVARYGKGVRGLPLAVDVSGALALAAGFLSAAAFVTEPGAHALGLTLLAVTVAAAATTAVLALIRARVTLTVLPIAAAVLVAVFGAVSWSQYDSPGYAMRYGQPVRMALPGSCVEGNGMGCVITWDRADSGPSSAFSSGQQVTVHFSEEGQARYGRYYALGGLYEPGDENDPTGVSLDARAVGGDAYVTLGYKADSWTPLGRYRLPGLVWAALPLFLLPLGLHLYLVRDRATHPLRRRRAG